MINIILFICVAIMAVGICLLKQEKTEFAGGIMTYLGAMLNAAVVVVFILLINKVVHLKTIDKRINMYEKENSKIEEQIALCVEQYQSHESEVFAEVAPDSAITLVALYPKLKSDALVSKQIDIYTTNNEKIKELKEEKIDGEVYCWWLYFEGNTNNE